MKCVVIVNVGRLCCCNKPPHYCLLLRRLNNRGLLLSDHHRLWIQLLPRADVFYIRIQCCTPCLIHSGKTEEENWVQHLCFPPGSDCPAHILLMVCSVAQSCLTLCDPMDCSPPGSSVCGIFLARIMEWVAILFSRSWIHISCISCIAGDSSPPGSTFFMVVMCATVVNCPCHLLLSLLLSHFSCVRLCVTP